MGLNVRVWFPASKSVREPLVVIEAAVPSTECWEAAARDGARVLHKIAPGLVFGAGERAALQFSYEDFTEELKAAAVAAFEDEWEKLVPTRG